MLASFSGNSSVNIYEKYISEHALPNEQIDAWLKWNKEANYDSITLKTSEPMLVRSLLNIDEKVFEFNKNDPEEFLIRREWVQVDGFFGFIAFYEKIPNDDITIDFTINFNKSDNLHSS